MLRGRGLLKPGSRGPQCPSEGRARTLDFHQPLRFAQELVSTVHFAVMVKHHGFDT